MLTDRQSRRSRRSDSRSRLALGVYGAIGIVIVLAGIYAAAPIASVRVSGSVAKDAASSRPLVINIAEAPSTIDPAAACIGPAVSFTGNLYARLTQYGSKRGPSGTSQVDYSKVKPWVARSWNISKNGRVYTFKLRKGLKFPSGAPVNARAVKYSFDRVLRMNQCGTYFLLDGLYKPPLIKQTLAPNPTTFIVKLSRPDANALQLWSTPAAGIVDATIVSKHGGVKKGKLNRYMASHAAGYAPFRLQSYEPNKRAVLVANKGFFQQPRSSKIIVNFISSDPTLLLQARSGNADVTLGLSKQAAKSLRGKKCCRVIANPAIRAEHVEFRWTAPPLNNRRFRAALTYAVPYGDILKKVAYGYGELYYGEWMPTFPFYNAKIGAPRRYNLARARQLINASGVSLPVNLTIITPEGSAVEKQIATILQGVWSQLRVNLRVRTLSSSAYFDTLDSKTGYDLATYLDGPAIPLPDYYWDYDVSCSQRGPHGFDYSDICIPAADKLIAKLRNTRNLRARQQILNKANRLFVAQSPRLQMYVDTFVAVLSKRVTHYFYTNETDFRTWARR